MRSAVYRSFVTCDDSKGVIECGTIRKSKFCSKEEVIRIGKKKKKQKEEVDESSLQLNEVAREALKLNRMADSYSKRSSFDGNSKEIAKDLLKGALDLQESLIMLGKLQESSNQVLGFQKQRLSVSGSGYNNNGYSKDCFDELREAIKQGLAKQNLLLRRRNPDFASTSSTTQSQSSSSSSIIENSQPRNPNLIAKLMGLDHIPIPPRANSYKQSQAPPIVLIKPTRFLNPDFDTKEMLKTKQMIKAADQKPVKRLNQEMGLNNMRRTRFKHQEESFKPKASAAGVPRKKKERSKPEEKKETIVPTITPRFQNSQQKRRNLPQNNDKQIKAKPKDKKLTTPKEIVNADPNHNQVKISEEKSIANKIDTKHVLLSSPLSNVVVDSGSENDRRLIIDYAKEFMQESFDKSTTVTLEQIVDEVCKGIGNQKENAGDGNGLDAVMIRSWDLGRKEMDLIVGDIEKMIIRELMDSLIIDFQYN